jgi:hypothetical membrane protein
MNARQLLIGGMAMPAVYLAGLAIAIFANPEFDALRQPPSDLGRTSSHLPMMMNLTLLAAALAGVVGATGLWLALKPAGALRAFLPALCLLLASTGLAMSGLFPLPNPLHYGFGLTTAGILIPVFGAVALWRSGTSRAPVLVLLGAFVLAAGMIATGIPLAPGVVMLISVAFLCFAVRRQAPVPVGQASA